MNVRTIFSKDTAPLHWYRRDSSINEHTVRLYGEVKGNIPIVSLVGNTYVISGKGIFHLTTESRKTKKAYNSLYTAMVQNNKFVAWGKDETLFAARGILVHRDNEGNIHPLFVLTVDVSDTSIPFNELTADKFQLYIDQGFEQSHKSIHSKFKREFIPAILDVMPIDVIYTFNIKKLFAQVQYPKFKTIGGMNEYSQHLLHGVIQNART